MPYLLRENLSLPSDARIGGVPNAPPNFNWPMCRTCKGPLQFLAQIPLDERCGYVGSPRVLLLFQCQNEPGMCDEWDAELGGNHAAIVPPSKGTYSSVPDGPTTLDSVSPVEFTPYDDSVAHETPDDNYCQLFDSDPLVMGKFGGTPLWIQGDETPTCKCGSMMKFVVQLEDRGGGGINFGDNGTGYGFVCDSCIDSAKFLWQCS